MARRYQPVLLAARMNYRLRQVEEALEQGDAARAGQEASELAAIWSRFGHVAGEAGTRVQEPLGALCASAGDGCKDRDAMQGHIRALDGLLRELAM